MARQIVAGNLVNVPVKSEKRGNTNIFYVARGTASYGEEFMTRASGSRHFAMRAAALMPKHRRSKTPPGEGMLELILDMEMSIWQALGFKMMVVKMLSCVLCKDQVVW